MEAEEKAYAKINLFLDVTDKRADGYHEIRTVMQSVSLADEVYLNIQEADYASITLHMEGCDVPADERNTAYLAAEAFLDKTGISAAVDIRVVKHIPVAAGLGGGSADAAAVLRALNTAFGTPLDRAALLALGAKVGADVPFCIVGGTRLCTGIGEKIEDADTDPLFYVIYASGEKVQTARAYAMLDRAFENFAVPNPGLHDMLYEGYREDNLLGMYNVFEGLILPECPLAEEARSRFYDLGARAAMMSGSGSAVYGVFDDKDIAMHAAEEMPGAVVCIGAPSCME